MADEDKTKRLEGGSTPDSAEEAVKGLLQRADGAEETIATVIANIENEADRLRLMAQGTFDVANALDAQANGMKAVVEDFMSVKVKDLGQGRLGENTVGGGKSSITIDKEHLVTGAPDEVELTLHHEDRHGDQVSPITAGRQAALIVDGNPITPLEVLEGDAEIASQVAMGRGPSTHRDGQPGDVYRRGQDAARKVRERAGEETWDKALTRDGGMSDVQVRLWEAGRDEGTLREEDVQREAAITGYTKEAENVLLDPDDEERGEPNAEQRLAA